MKKIKRTLSIQKETLRNLTTTGLRGIAGADTCTATEFSICSCNTNPTQTDPGCGPSCELQVC